MRGQDLRNAVVAAGCARPIIQNGSARNDPPFVVLAILRRDANEVVAVIKSPMASFRIEVLNLATVARTNVELFARYVVGPIENEFVHLPNAS